MLEIIISLSILISAGYLIAKNYDAKVVLLFGGLFLMLIATALGHPVLSPSASTGSIWLDPLKRITQVFNMQMGIVGLTIMTLFGFANYMNQIGANTMAVTLLSKPVRHIRSPYLLVPIIFILGNLMSLVLPSASGLAILLMATLYPVMRATGMTPLTAGAVIATTATIFPTPLGSDNIVVGQHLGISAIEYVVKYHALISLPTLLVIAIVHYFWQRYMDRAHPTTIIETKLENNVENNHTPTWYAILPILPIILLLFFHLAFIDRMGKSNINIGLVEITLICLIVTLLIELIRKRAFRSVTKEFNLFFEGMGQGFSQVVSLIIAAGVFVEGLKSIGVINILVDNIKGLEGVGTLLMFAFSGITVIIGFISGSGLAVFHSLIKIIPEITRELDVNTISVVLPMQLTANLIRAASPVAAVVIVVATIIKVNPIELIKRTAVPLGAGIITTLILSYYFFG